MQLREEPDADVLSTAPAGFLSFADDGTILRTNDRLLNRLGYARHELEGQHIETILSTGGRIFYYTHFFPLLKLQGQLEEIYFPLRTKNGDDIPMLSNAVRLQREGRVVNDCIFMRMTRRHIYEDELLRARKAAENASASKARFLSMMSHDLRTPLTAISGFADLIRAGARGPITDEQREDLLAIKKAAEQMMTLMNDILGFAQLESGRVELKTQPVKIADALDRSESLMRIQFTNASIQYEQRVAESGLTAVADPERLQQILLNLLTNAVKFTPAGGKIIVDCRREASRVLIDVCDTGIGIPEDRLQEIFDPFVQVGEQNLQSHHGVGLGLSIGRDLARAMGGDLSVRSKPGEGSVFTIALPAVVSAT